MKTKNYFNLLVCIAVITIFPTVVFSGIPPEINSNLSNMFISVYDINDTTKQAIISSVPQNYKNGTKWVQIDKKLKNDTVGKDKNGKHYNILNENGVYSAYFPTKYKTPVIIQYENTLFEFSVDEINGKKAKTNDIIYTENSATYIDVFDNTNIKYEYLPNTLKETIVINQSLTTDLTIKSIFNGTMQGLVINNPYILDANGILRQVNATLIGNTYTITAWQNDLNDMTYPIYIDPSISTNLTSPFIQDTYADRNTQNQNYSATTPLILRKDPTDRHEKRTYYRINLSDTIIQNASKITDAQFETEFASTIDGFQVNITLHEIYRPNLGFNITKLDWSNQTCGTANSAFNASCNNNHILKALVTNPQIGQRINFTITQFANDSLLLTPYKGIIGFVLNASTTTSDNQEFYIYSAEAGGNNEPQVYITYESNNPPSIVNMSELFNPTNQNPYNNITFNATLSELDGDGFNLANATFGWNGYPTHIETTPNIPEAIQLQAAILCTMTAQPFYPSNSGWITNISIRVFPTITQGTKDFHIEIWKKMSGGKGPAPNGRIEAGYVNITPKGIYASQRFDVILNNTVYVTAGVTYFVVVNNSLSNGYVYVERTPSLGVAPNLTAFSSTNCGNSWGALSSGRALVLNVTISNFSMLNNTPEIKTGSINYSVTSKIAYWATPKNLGNFTWQVCANDSKSLQGCGTRNFIVLNFTDIVAPSTLLISPPNNTILNGNVTLTATTSDNGNVAYTEFYYMENNTGTWSFYSNGSEVSNDVWQITWNTGTFNDKSHWKWRVFAVDQSANGAYGNFYNYSIDRSKPFLISYRVIYPNASLSWTGYGKNITILLNVSDAQTAISSVLVNSTYFNSSSFDSAIFYGGTNAANQTSAWNITYLFIHRNQSGFLLNSVNITDNSTPKNSLIPANIAINLDSIAPSITSCVASITPPTVGDNVTFSCDIYDNMSQIQTYTLSHNFSGTWKNESWKYISSVFYTGFFNYVTNMTGNYAWFFWANDSLNNIGNSSMNVLTVLAAPNMSTLNVTITAPINNSIVSSTFNVSYLVKNSYKIIEARIDMDGVPLTYNSTPVTANATNQINLSGISEGWHLFEVFVTDELLETNISDALNYTIDAIYPTIILADPQNITYTTSNRTINFHLSEPNPDKCVYSLNGGVNVTLASCTNGSTFLIANGFYNFTLYTNDTAGNQNNTGIVFFTVDTPLPQLILDDPDNTSYTNKNISLNFRIGGPNIDKCYYILNSGQKTIMPSCNNGTIKGDFGFNEFIMFVNDTAGNWNESAVNFTVGVGGSLDDPIRLFCTMIALPRLLCTVSLQDTNANPLENANITWEIRASNNSLVVYNPTLFTELGAGQYFTTYGLSNPPFIENAYFVIVNPNTTTLNSSFPFYVPRIIENINSTVTKINSSLNTLLINASQILDNQTLIVQLITSTNTTIVTAVHSLNITLLQINNTANRINSSVNILLINASQILDNQTLIVQLITSTNTTIVTALNSMNVTILQINNTVNRINLSTNTLLINASQIIDNETYIVSLITMSNTSIINSLNSLNITLLQINNTANRINSSVNILLINASQILDNQTLIVQLITQRNESRAICTSVSLPTLTCSISLRDWISNPILNSNFTWEIRGINNSIIVYNPTKFVELGNGEYLISYNLTNNLFQEGNYIAIFDPNVTTSNISFPFYVPRIIENINNTILQINNSANILLINVSQILDNQTIIIQLIKNTNTSILNEINSLNVTILQINNTVNRINLSTNTLLINASQIIDNETYIVSLITMSNTSIIMALNGMNVTILQINNTVNRINLSTNTLLTNASQILDNQTLTIQIITQSNTSILNALNGMNATLLQLNDTANNINSNLNSLISAVHSLNITLLQINNTANRINSSVNILLINASQILDNQTLIVQLITSTNTTIVTALNGMNVTILQINNTVNRINLSTNTLLINASQIIDNETYIVSLITMSNTSIINSLNSLNITLLQINNTANRINSSVNILLINASQILDNQTLIISLIKNHNTSVINILNDIRDDLDCDNEIEICEKLDIIISDIGFKSTNSTVYKEFQSLRELTTGLPNKVTEVLPNSLASKSILVFALTVLLIGLALYSFIKKGENENA